MLLSVYAYRRTPSNSWFYGVAVNSSGSDRTLVYDQTSNPLAPGSSPGRTLLFVPDHVHAVHCF